ncbi:hypothetical protein BH09PSE6_BH09PSE6_03830 [soil metagenome]
MADDNPRDPRHAPFPIKDGPEHKPVENGNKPGPAVPAPVVPEEAA